MEEEFNFKKELWDIYEENSMHYGTYQKIEKLRKEFIRRLKNKINNYRTATYNYKFLKELDRFVDKLAGEKLIENGKGGEK